MSYQMIKQPKEIPVIDPVPFAPIPLSSQNLYWPVKTSHSRGREVAYLAEDDSIIGDSGRMFMADRHGKDGERYHAGIDLYANPGDIVVACEDGIIVFFNDDFYKGTSAILVEHEDKVINYGEVAKDSLEKYNLKVNDTVQAGQVIGYIVKNTEGTSMCHFETYIKGTRVSRRWMKTDPRPRELLNPTRYLLFLQQHGL